MSSVNFSVLDDYGDYVTVEGDLVSGIDISTLDADIELGADGASKLVAGLRPLFEDYDPTSAPDNLSLQPSLGASATPAVSTEDAINTALAEVAARYNLNVEFRYADSDTAPIEHRLLKVEGVFATAEGNTCMVGTCPDRRGEYRSFRIDRIKGAVTPV